MSVRVVESRLARALWAALVAATMGALAVGCGGESSELDAGPGRDAALPRDAGPPGSGESAAQLYGRLCASCHGELGEGGIGPTLVDSRRSVDELTTIIDERMPQGAPNRCDGACPRTLAEYILATFTTSALSCDGGVPPSPRRLRLLSRREYRATVRDLLELPADPTGPSTCNLRTFTFVPGRSVRSVHLAGSFNGWSAAAWPMTEVGGGGGGWSIEREIPNGTHQYKFVIDGSEWVLDPTNPERTDDGFGGQNSVITVDCASGGATSFDPAASLPTETRPEGFFFDDDAASGVVSPVHVREQLKAARLAVERARDHLGTLVGCDLSADRAGCVASFVRGFGRRAFRRPLTDAERARYEALALGGTDASAGAERTMRAMLVSPAFLYRSEMGTASGATFTLTPHELASALSYQLWGTTPDDALLDAADRGELVDLASREREARRLLADPRARAQVADFAEMWLGIEDVAERTKSASVYPTWSTDLGADMREETRRFVTFVVFDGSHGLDELWTSPDTFVNERLARHYGITGVMGDAFVRATLPTGGAAGPRSGLLGHGSILAVTAHSDQSSPIRRGLFVRQRLLCQTFPLPPANAGGVPDVDPSATTRERFAQHTSNEGCAGCHRYIDPIGFGFEGFDGIGAWRTSEGGRPIDTSGDLNDVEGLGTGSMASFTNMTQLGAALAAARSPEACFVRQYFRFARGYREVVADRCAIDALVARYRTHGDLRELLIDVLLSPDFATRAEVTR